MAGVTESCGVLRPAGFDQELEWMIQRWSRKSVSCIMKKLAFSAAIYYTGVKEISGVPSI